MRKILAIVGSLIAVAVALALLPLIALTSLSELTDIKI